MIHRLLTSEPAISQDHHAHDNRRGMSSILTNSGQLSSKPGTFASAAEVRSRQKHLGGFVWVSSFAALRAQTRLLLQPRPLDAVRIV